MPPRPSRVSWRPFTKAKGSLALSKALPGPLEVPPGPLEPFRSPGGLSYLFHAMALSAPSEYLLAPSEVQQQPPRPS